MKQNNHKITISNRVACFQNKIMKICLNIIKWQIVKVWSLEEVDMMKVDLSIMKISTLIALKIKNLMMRFFLLKRLNKFKKLQE